MKQSRQLGISRALVSLFAAYAALPPGHARDLVRDAIINLGGVPPG